MSLFPVIVSNWHVMHLYIFFLYCIKLLGEVRSTLKGVLNKNFYVDTFPDFTAAISVHRKCDDFSQV